MASTKLSSLVLVWLMTSACVALGPSEALSYTSEDFENCLEKKLPAPEPLGQSLGEGVRVVVRIVPSWLPSLRVTATRSRSGEVTAEVLQIDSEKSLGGQHKRQREDKGRTVESICDDLPVKRLIPDEQTLQKVAEALEDLETLTAPVIFERLVYVDSREYEVWIATGSNSVYFQWTGLDPEVPGEQGAHPLAEWTFELVTAMGVKLVDSN